MAATVTTDPTPSPPGAADLGPTLNDALVAYVAQRGRVHLRELRGRFGVDPRDATSAASTRLSARLSVLVAKGRVNRPERGWYTPPSDAPTWRQPRQVEDVSEKVVVLARDEDVLLLRDGDGQRWVARPI